MRATVKYLSVIETIEVGNTIRNIESGELKVVDESSLPTDGIWSKAKPFAVIQDIKVGDEVAIFNDQGIYVRGGTLTVLHEDTAMVDGEDFSPNEGESFTFYKVLGEISPNAKFVEDGKGYEMRPKKEPAILSDGIAGEVLDFNSANDILKYYEVKCPGPCNTYH